MNELDFFIRCFVIPKSTCTKCLQFVLPKSAQHIPSAGTRVVVPTAAICLTKTEISWV